MVDPQITISTETQSGGPVFLGTRLPVKNLFDYLKDGENIEGFLAGFPSVTYCQVLPVMAASAK